MAAGARSSRALPDNMICVDTLTLVNEEETEEVADIFRSTRRSMRDSL